MGDRWVYAIIAAGSFAECAVVTWIFRHAFGESVWGFMWRKVAPADPSRRGGDGA